MDGDQHLWQVWAEAIQRWGWEKPLASFLESLGSLTILGAQIIYFVSPFIPRKNTEEHLTSFARLLENPELTRAFARMLRESDSL